MIVPTLNEERVIAGCLDRLRALGFDDVLVVDGGSSDKTVDLATGRAGRVATDTAGLFEQLNRGAELATGDIVLFHYADGDLPDGAMKSLQEAFVEPTCVGGAFCLRFDSSKPVYRAIAFGAGVRNRLGFGPFGDQSIFVRREVFDAIGGFRPSVFLSDFDLVKRLRRRGRFSLLHDCVVSSVRRWEEHGFWRTVWKHWKLSALYLASAGRVGRRARTEQEKLRELR